jgi:hypothetical protein
MGVVASPSPENLHEPRRAPSHVRDIDIDVADLAFRKDGLIAEYQARANKWHAVQAAGLAFLPLGLLAWLSGTVDARGFLVIIVSALVTIALAAFQLGGHEGRFETGLIGLLSEMQSLKGKGAP